MHHVAVLVGGRCTGGEAAGGTLVHCFDPQARAWLPVVQRGSPPGRLHSHAAAAFGTSLVLCGGGDGKRISSELFTLTLTPTPNDAPVALAGLGVAAAASAVMAAAGGASEAGAGAGAVGAVSAEWAHPQVRGAPPPPCVGHCVARLGVNGLVLFGGFAGGGYSNALYALQPDKMLWSQPSVFCAEGSAAPAARLGATATALHAHAALLLFGAQGGVALGVVDLLEASGDDLSEPHCTLCVSQPVLHGAPPPPRFNHCAALLAREQLAVFGGSGGRDGGAALHDLALLTLRGLRWEVLQFRGVPPAPRAAHVGVAVGARLWVFGGAAADGRLLNDVHFAELPRQAAPAMPPRGAAALPPAGQPLPAAAAAASRAAAAAVAVGAAAVGKPAPPRLLPPPLALLRRAGPTLTRPLPTVAIEPLWPVRRRPDPHAAVAVPAACSREVCAVSVKLEPAASAPPKLSAAGLGTGEGGMGAGPTTTPGTPASAAPSGAHPAPDTSPPRQIVFNAGFND